MTKEEKAQRITKILEAFRLFDAKYKREEVDDAIELKEEITLYLIEILEGVLAAPEKYTENDDFFDHIYALTLLGHFKETRAHKVIVDLFSLSPEFPDELFGDMITEDLPYILVNTCGGTIDHIKSLILNKDADVFCRCSASRALTYAVVKGYTTREETLTFFETLFTGNEAEKYSNFWGMLACSVNDLYPDIIMDTIRHAYEEELIDPMSITLSDFESDLTLEKDKVLKSLERIVEADRLADIHKNMSSWACFRDKSQETSKPDFSSFSPSLQNLSTVKIDHKSMRKKTQAKKNKAKQAKASKRKNRGKKKK